MDRGLNLTFWIGGDNSGRRLVIYDSERLLANIYFISGKYCHKRIRVRVIKRLGITRFPNYFGLLISTSSINFLLDGNDWKRLGDEDRIR